MSNENNAFYDADHASYDPFRREARESRAEPTPLFAPLLLSASFQEFVVRLSVIEGLLAKESTRIRYDSAYFPQRLEVRA